MGCLGSSGAALLGKRLRLSRCSFIQFVATIGLITSKHRTMPVHLNRSPSPNLGLILAASLFLAASCAFAAAPATIEVDPVELPRLPAVPLDKAISTFEIKKGFHLELVAHEPQVVDPVTIAFDEHGRMFAVEMRDYSERRDETPHLGTIRLLEDSDGDGHYEKATVYADDLPFPTAVICWNGGIFVAASPDILWFKDTNGDGRADERKVVFTGFGAGRNPLNMQALLNSFNWGLDNRIYGATAPNGGTITSPANPAMKPLNLNGRDFSFDPRTMDMRAEGPTAQYGMSFDNRGRKFSSSNSRHIMAEMYPPRYAGLNPHYNMLLPLVDIGIDGAAAEVFRISPDEPWRIIRTRWRIAGVVKGVVEGGGRVSGYFTGATGLTIYRGNAYGPEFVGNAFIGDAGGNLVHRKIIQQNGRNGVALIAQRPGDEQKVEFLASRDTWFRPVHFANAPDGCLYVIDMHRETIEHPWSIPEPIKKHLDLNSGNDRGRVYRIAPDGFKQPPLPALGKADTAELVQTLAHPNGWHRDTAARLLYERQDKSAVTGLKALLKNPAEARGHMHALHALQGLGSLEIDDMLQGGKSPDAGARAAAVALLERQTSSEHSLSVLMALKDDPDPQVRHQVALSAASLQHMDKVPVLAALGTSDGADKWLQGAVLNSSAGVEIDLAEAVTRLAGPVRAASFLGELLRLAGSADAPGSAARVIRLISEVRDQAAAISLTQAYGEGLLRARSSLEKADASGQLQPIFDEALKVVSDNSAGTSTRIQAIHLLKLRNDPGSRKALLALIQSGVPQPVQLEALSALSRSVDSVLATSLIGRWNEFSSQVRDQAVRILLARPEHAKLLLAAMEAGGVPADVLSASQIAQLRGHKDKVIAERAAKLFPDASKSRQTALASFEPALQLPGDAARGRKIYQTRCAPCHRSGEEGHPVGPDMVTMKTMGREKLLASILDPNREIAPQFIAFTVETRDGESLLAVITSETGTSVTLRMPSGQEKTIQRSEIAGMRSSGQSMMPEGLEAGLLIPDMADLLAFIESQ